METAEHYDRMMFKEALKTGFFEFQVVFLNFSILFTELLMFIIVENYASLNF